MGRVHGIMKYFLVLALALAVAVLLSILMIVTSSGVKNNRVEKSRPFECGFLGIEERRSPFRVHFFLVSLIFLVFDIELVILFPYLCNIVFSVRPQLEFMVLVFIVFLTVGLLVEWEKSMLEWLS